MAGTDRTISISQSSTIGKELGFNSSCTFSARKEVRLIKHLLVRSKNKSVFTFYYKDWNSASIDSKLHSLLLTRYTIVDLVM
jgi:hypothetical protein